MSPSNENDNKVVKFATSIIYTFERLLVVLFDGLKNAVDHANPSLFSLVATLLPFILPLPVAFMTSNSALQFFDGWEPWSANVLGFGLEGLGLLVWVNLADAFLDKDDNKGVMLYGIAAIGYEALLIFINVMFVWTEGAEWFYAAALLLICLLPAISAMLYASQKQNAERRLASEKLEQKEIAERIRQEKRQDRKEAAALKLQREMEATLPDDAKFQGQKMENRKQAKQN